MNSCRTISHHHRPGYPLPTHIFIRRFIRNIIIGLFIVGISLFIGMWGYHTFENMSWIDAYVSAAMILSGMGPMGPLSTHAGKIFAGSYALFSGVLFLVVVGVVFAPVVHRFFHKFHIEEKSDL